MGGLIGGDNQSKENLKQHLLRVMVEAVHYLIIKESHQATARYNTALDGQGVLFYFMNDKSSQCTSRVSFKAMI